MFRRSLIVRGGISTHDLTKRSTASRLAPASGEIFQLTTSRRGRRSCSVMFRRWIYFNSRPHEEVDRGRPITFPLRFTFQLTTSRRGRRSIDPLKVVEQHFNSRPHEEVDGKSTQITPYFCSYIWHILPKHTTQLHTTIFIYFFFQQILSKTRCESSTISCLLHARTGRSSFQKIKVSVTSNPGLAPICSTLF